MKILAKLDEITNYFESTRRVGHTQTLINGIVNTQTPCIFLTANYEDEKTRRSIKGSDVNMSLNSLLDGGLRGYNRPLVLDNYAISELCSEASWEFKKLQTENAKLKNKLSKLKQLILEN